MDILKQKNFISILINTAAQLTTKLSGSLTTFIITILISYLIGFGNYGSFIKVTTFVSLFYLLIDFGINSMFLKNHFEAVEKLFGNLLQLRLVMAFVLWIMIIILALFLPYDPAAKTGFSPFEKMGLVVYGLTLFTESINQTLNSIFQKHLLFKKSIFPSILGSVLLILFVLWGIKIQSLTLIFISYPVSEIVTYALSYAIIQKRVGVILKSEKLGSFSRQLLRASFPLALMIFLNLIYFQADTFILSLMKPTPDVGVYGFSYKFFEFIITIPTFFSASVFPILIAKQSDKKAFINHFISYSFFLLLASGILLPAVYFLAPLLGLIKPEFALSIAPLRILALSLPFFFLTSIFQWLLILKNRQNALIGIYFVSMIINIVLNLLYIPRYSYIASAYITVFSEGLVLLCMIVLIYKLKAELLEKS